MFRKAPAHPVRLPAASGVDAVDPGEPRGHVWREEPLARMQRERDERAARHGFGLFG